MNRRSTGEGLAVGLTGGIGCGKSAVGRFLADLGAAVIDADDVAHELLRTDAALVERIERRFGRGAVGADGRVNRRALADIVFADESARRELESLIHPEVLRRVEQFVADQKREGRVAVAIVPLLYEVGFTGPWDAVVCVTAPAEEVIRRLAARGMTEADVRARMRAQMPVEEKVSKSDMVIVNDGDLGGLKEKTGQVWSRLLNKERSSHARKQGKQIETGASRTGTSPSA